MKQAVKITNIIFGILGVCAIYPLILALICNKKLEEATSVDDLRVWAILAILFFNLPGGIIMLCMKDKDLLE